jgi:hypothetical protein
MQLAELTNNGASVPEPQQVRLARHHVKLDMADQGHGKFGSVRDVDRDRRSRAPLALTVVLLEVAVLGHAFEPDWLLADHCSGRDRPESRCSAARS